LNCGWLGSEALSTHCPAEQVFPSPHGADALHTLGSKNTLGASELQWTVATATVPRKREERNSLALRMEGPRFGARLSARMA